MSLHLDPRQRAMLRELGVRVWQPVEAVAEAKTEPVVAITVVATHAEDTGAIARLRENRVPAKALAKAPMPRQTPAPQAAAAEGGGPAAWRLGEAQALYREAAPAPGARWWVLAEAQTAALQAAPFQGDAGKLLDNMLRAARMNRAGAVLFAPLLRQASSGMAPDFSAALAALLARVQPDVVLVMGRLAAQAVLRSTEPLGKLRGQLHRLQGVNTVATYDAHYLLQRPADKARAWDDLCLALSLTPRPA